MMRYLLISVAAALAVAGAATIATAQDDKNKSPGSEGNSPSPGAAQQAPETGKAEKQQPKAAQQREPGTTDRPKSTQKQQGPGNDQPKAAQQPQPGTDKQKSTQQPDPAKDQPKAAQQPQPGADKQKSTQQQPEPGKDQPKAAQQPGTDKAGGRTQVSEEQRTNIRERLVKQTRVERTRINVSINVGTAVPRSVRLHALPVEIVAIVPAYRAYNYVLLEDETIVIVDPRTYVIVDVIDTGGRGRAQFALSADDRRFLFTTLPRDRTADVRVRLALGAEVPRDVELLTFPSVVTARVPEVQRYRYIVSGDDIVIVDPSDNGVVLVIDE